MQFTEAITNYGGYQEVRGDSPCHRRECQRILSLASRWLGNPVLETVSDADLIGFLKEVRRRPGLKGRLQVSDHTLLAYYRTLGAFFAYLNERELLRSNPMARVPRPKTAQYLIQPFSGDQVQKLLAEPDLTTFTGLRDLTLMCFLLDTGCRISECLTLTMSNLDLDRRLARVMGKGKKERDIPFGTRTLAWLERYLERRQESQATDFVFVNQYGERLTPNAMSHRIAGYGRSAGLRGVRTSPHTFRHTFGVNWLLGNGEYKGDTLSLQKILGHSTPAMTQKYVHFAGQDLRKLHDRLSPCDRLAPVPPEQRRRLR